MGTTRDTLMTIRLQRCRAECMERRAWPATAIRLLANPWEARLLPSHTCSGSAGASPSQIADHLLILPLVLHVFPVLIKGAWLVELGAVVDVVAFHAFPLGCLASQ